MAPILVLAVKALLPVLFAEATKKITEGVNPPGESVQVEAAKVAVKAAVVSVRSSKTVWFSLALGILGVIEQHADVLGPMLGQKWGWVLVAVGGATAILRTLTTSSLIDKVEPKE